MVPYCITVQWAQYLPRDFMALGTYYVAPLLILARAADTAYMPTTKSRARKCFSYTVSGTAAAMSLLVYPHELQPWSVLIQVHAT